MTTEEYYKDLLQKAEDIYIKRLEDCQYIISKQQEIIEQQKNIITIVLSKIMLSKLEVKKDEL